MSKTKADSMAESYVAVLDSCVEFYNALFADADDEPDCDPKYDTYLDMCTNAAAVVCDKYKYDMKEINSIVRKHSSYPKEAKSILKDWIETVVDMKDDDPEFEAYYKQYVAANPKKRAK